MLTERKTSNLDYAIDEDFFEQRLISLVNEKHRCFNYGNYSKYFELTKEIEKAKKLLVRAYKINNERLVRKWTTCRLIEVGYPRAWGRKTDVKVAYFNYETGETVLVPANCHNPKMYMYGYDAYFSGIGHYGYNKLNNPDFNQGYLDASDNDKGTK